MVALQLDAAVLDSRLLSIPISIKPLHRPPKPMSHWRKVDRIRIAVAIPDSSPLSSYGAGVQNGTMLAIRHINARGGVLGRTLWRKIYDDDSSPESPNQTIAVANKIIKDKVKFVVRLNFTTPIAFSSYAAVEVLAQAIAAAGDWEDPISENIARLCVWVHVMESWKCSKGHSKVI